MEESKASTVNGKIRDERDHSEINQFRQEEGSQEWKKGYRPSRIIVMIVKNYGTISHFISNWFQQILIKFVDVCW